MRFGDAGKPFVCSGPEIGLLFMKFFLILSVLVSSAAVAATAPPPTFDHDVAPIPST